MIVSFGVLAAGSRVSVGAKARSVSKVSANLNIAWTVRFQESKEPPSKKKQSVGYSRILCIANTLIEAKRILIGRVALGGFR